MIVYNSWDENYKRPFGAVEQDCPVYFTIRPEKTLSVQYARLRIFPDGKPCIYHEMKRLGAEGERDTFYCECVINETGLYWYDFELDTNVGIKYITLHEGGSGRIAEHSGEFWQLTVYEAGFDTPDWLKGGIIYQIFPDRFAKDGDLPEAVPEGRYIREDWGGLPEHREDEEGKYLNNTYFGGNLRGIESKLPYLKMLGVSAIYLNPVFEAHSNHRYNTADYMKIDPLLGTEPDFTNLCRVADSYGIRIILDGVFSHTGDDSRYFNRNGRYSNEKGAYESMESKYFSWYDFKKWPEDYRCWWGYKTLPEVDESNDSYLDFITGPNGVLEHWQKAGAAGWRLDVADELPDEFLRVFRQAVKSFDSEAVIYGEVWEDASRKVSYGRRRTYLSGSELDSTMNYPFRDAIIAFLKGSGAKAFIYSVTSILENYPKPCIDVLMNLLGTHDTSRIITELVGDKVEGRDRKWKASHFLSDQQRTRGLKLIKLAAVLQFFLPGVPCIYYGDEAGFEGYEDPFNRQCYRWGDEDKALIDFYCKLGDIHRACPALRTSSFMPLLAEGSLIVFERLGEENGLICAVNQGCTEGIFRLPKGYRVIWGEQFRQEDELIIAEAESYVVFGKGSWSGDF